MYLINIFLKAIFSILLFSFTYSLLLNINFIELSIKPDISFLNFFSWFYLISFYLIFSYYFIVWLGVIYFYEKYKIYNKYHFIYISIFIFILYLIVSLFVFERDNFSTINRINDLIYIFLNILFNMFILKKYYTLKIKELEDKNA